MSENVGVGIITQPLQDISLEKNAVEIAADEGPECSVDSSKAKNNSLKRFFKLPQKKKQSGSASDDNQLADTSNHDCNIQDEKIDDKTTHKRFSLRLGGLHRHMSSLNLERATKSEVVACTKSTSKTTLRSSLSNYWGVMFKKNKKDKQQQQQQQQQQEQVQEQQEKQQKVQESKESETEQKIATTNLNTTAELNATIKPDASALNDEVHALKISDEKN